MHILRKYTRMPQQCMEKEILPASFAGSQAGVDAAAQWLLADQCSACEPPPPAASPPQSAIPRYDTL